MLSGIQRPRACDRYCLWIDSGALYFLTSKQIIFKQPQGWAIGEEGAAVCPDVEPARLGIESHFNGVALLAEVCDYAASGVWRIFNVNMSRRPLFAHDVGIATALDDVIPREKNWRIHVLDAARGHARRSREVVDERSASHRGGGARSQRHEGSYGYRTKHIFRSGPDVWLTI